MTAPFHLLEGNGWTQTSGSISRIIRQQYMEETKNAVENYNNNNNNNNWMIFHINDIQETEHIL